MIKMVVDIKLNETNIMSCAVCGQKDKGFMIHSIAKNSWCRQCLEFIVYNEYYTKCLACGFQELFSSNLHNIRAFHQHGDGVNE